ncbi:MAG: trehalose-phosphatase [Myxococcales bacterium]|nr:trehalose-phosphatase [Myxococcales bacterium]
MIDVLSPAQKGILEQYAWSNVLLAFDFDGTLSPIVRDRDTAGMRATTHRLLAAVTKLYPCAVISGRSRTDVAARLNGLPVRFVVGNHGLEPNNAMPRFARAATTLREQLAPMLVDVQGVEIEDKQFSLAIHYRKSRAKRAAKRAIIDALAHCDLAHRIVPGKLVFNLLPEGAPHKGVALRELRRKAGVDTAIYVGDDVTDEDVFQLSDLGVLGIRVGADARSAASYCVRDQRSVDRLLSRLVMLRTETGSRRAGA